MKRVHVSCVEWSCSAYSPVLPPRLLAHSFDMEMKEGRVVQCGEDDPCITCYRGEGVHLENGYGPCLLSA